LAYSAHFCDWCQPTPDAPRPPDRGIDRVDGDLHDLAPLLVGQRRVLAEGTVRPDATATVAHQEVDVFAELVVVDSQTCRGRIVLLERQRGGDDDTAEIHAVFTHTDFLSDVVVD
jgi:hypothetical protein